MCYTSQFKINRNVCDTAGSNGHHHSSSTLVIGSVGRFPPDGLSTSAKRDVELDSRISTLDQIASDDYFNEFSPVHQLFSNMTEELNTMNPGPEEPPSGLNGRLRPRKSYTCHTSPHATKSQRRLDGKTGQDKVKRTSTPSKTPPGKPDDLAPKSAATFLCPYCDRSFASKQSTSKHARRMHGLGSKQDGFIPCLFCNNFEADAQNIIRHMAESHSQVYFACINCHSRYHSQSDLAEHKIKACDPKQSYRNKLRQAVPNDYGKDKFRQKPEEFSEEHGFNGVVISCELKPSHESDGADIEDNITTNLILPPSKTLGTSTVVEKSAVIVLDDIQWNKRIPPNFSFHNTDADQILSRLGVVHRSPRTGESSKKDWKTVDDCAQKFEKCFDTSFYSKVASNVQENLSKYLDGSFHFNPEPDSTIKTRKSKNSVMINTAEGFPILLASEQFSRNEFDRCMPRAFAPKHKWKWDNLESDKSPDNPHQVKRDSHTNNCIITLVSSLDIWSQLQMRRKFEEKFGCAPLEKKTEKQTIISNELRDILESRELPSTSTRVVKVTNVARASSAGAEFPASLGLVPTQAREPLSPAVLSGEWVRPRSYVCCACGAHSPDSRAASTHASTQHPNAEVQHYEIVGEQLLNADILKHLYVPPSQMCNRTRPLRGFRECTKCTKSITLEDLHQHMLDCAGDTPAVRRKCRYRPFGMRRRRPRLPDNTIRKKIRKDIRRQTRPKGLMRPRPIRTEVGDAETIRKMIADLPAKRHRVLINPNNTYLRPRIKQRPKPLIKGLSTEDVNKRNKSSNKEREETQLECSTSDKTSVKSDEDKPLKPKRMAAKAIRCTPDSDKSKIKKLVRPKRISLQGKELSKKKRNIDLNNSNRDLKNITTEELSLDNSPKKVDIQNVDFQPKEHVGRGNSNNRDGERPSCSGQNGAARNRCDPAQNVPLKHSIARLTADSEKHDKSVQFHHLFLVQQECNNINQHVPSGQELLFENEAAVLTLDKPPLHCNSKGPLDAFSAQRNKLNKPRKGLNDCIAMLKNKLVEPDSNIEIIPTGHVSVQCGDDEPLYFEPDTPLRTLVSLDRNVEVFSQSEKEQNNSLNQTAIQEAITKREVNKDETNSFTHNADSNNKKSFAIPGQVTVKRKSLNYGGSKRESIRRKSIVKEVKMVEITSQLDVVSQKDEVCSKDTVFQKDYRSQRDAVLEKDAVFEKDHLPGKDIVSKEGALLVKHLVPQKDVVPQKDFILLKDPIAQKHQVLPQKDSVPLKDFISQNHDELPQNYIESISSKTLLEILPISAKKSLHKDKRRTDNCNKIKPQKAAVFLRDPIAQNPDVLPQKDAELLKDDLAHNHGILPPKDLLAQRHDVLAQNDAILLKDNIAQKYDVLPPKDVLSQKHDVLPRNYTERIPSKPVSEVVPRPVNTSLHKDKRRTDKGNKTDQDIKKTSAVISKKFVTEEETQQSGIIFSSNKYPLNQETVEHSDHDANSQASINLNVATNEGQSNEYYENCFNLQQQTDIHLSCEYDRNVFQDSYSAADFNRLTVNIRPAHASTNIESIVSIPLDLSGKSSNTNMQKFNSRDDVLLLKNSYETYETLDLSNKNQELNYRALDNAKTDNEVVDLSIRSSYSKIRDDLFTGSDNVTDLSVKIVNTDIPTDLTVRNSSRMIEDSAGQKKCIEAALSYDEHNKDTEVEGPLANEISGVSPTDLSEKESKSHCMSLISTSCNDNIKVLKSTSTEMPPQSKSTELKMATTFSIEKSSITVPDNLPSTTEILRKMPDDIVKHLPTTIGNLNESATNNIRDLKKSIENTGLLTDSRAVENPSLAQKPVYDPTLIIPQYKIRGACTVDALAHLQLSTNAESQIVHSLSAASTESPNYVTATAVKPHEVLVMTTVGKSLISTQEQAYSDNESVLRNVSNQNTRAEYESVSNIITPVCTQANACITVTKIESANSIRSTTSLISTPVTITAITTSVYTIAGITTCAPTHSSQISPASIFGIHGTEHADNSSLIEKSQEVSQSNSSKNKGYKKNMGHDWTGTVNPLQNLEHDAETARKIALLPKELVDILGNMPVDHRNQLLNVLPQYVSTPTSTPGLRSDLTNNSKSSEKNAPTESNFAVPSLVNIEESGPKNTSQLRTAQEENENTHTLPTIPHFENKSSGSSETHPCSSIQPKIKLAGNVTSGETFNNQELANFDKEHRKLDKKTDMVSDDSFTALSKNTPPKMKKNNVKKVSTDNEIASHAEILNEPPLETSPQVSLLVHPRRKKVNNDQTASLRAVRIKTPSERQKSTDSQLLQRGTMTPLISGKINSELDNDVIKSLQMNVTLNTDAFMAIQQAEVSSTQHTNKHLVLECKFPSAISPNAQGLNVGNTKNSTARQISTVSEDASMGSGSIENVTSISKSILITSSIVNNIDNNESTDASTNSELLNKQSSTKSYPTNSTAQKSSTVITHDISESCEKDWPRECSLEKSKLVPNEHKDQRRTSVKSSDAKTCDEQEDSDDDLSLAVICKQKNQSVPKKKVPDDKAAPKSGSIGVRKKARKHRKTENVGAAPLLPNSSNVQTSVTVKKQVSPISENNDQSIIQDQSLKHKGSKVRRSNANRTTDKNQIESSGEVKRVIVATAEVSISDNSKCDLYTSVLKNERNCSNNLAQKSSEDLESINSSNEIINVLKQEELSQNPPHIKSKVQAEKPLSGPGKEHYEQRHSIVRQSSKDMEENGIEITDSQNDSNKFDISYSQLNEKITEHNSGLSNVKEDIIIDNTNTNKLSESTSTDTNISLRRTRQSVNLLDHEYELLHAQALLENRTPLTKKQLIFSKLLLDEENNIKLSESPSVSENKPSDLPEAIPSEPVFIKYDMDENKPGKRKRSPNIKRKFKKKMARIRQDPSAIPLNETSRDIPIISLVDKNQVRHSEQFFDNLETYAPPATEHNELSPANTDSSLLQDKKCKEKRKSSDSIYSELSPNSPPKITKLGVTEDRCDENTLHTVPSKTGEDDAQLKKDEIRDINLESETLTQDVDSKNIIVSILANDNKKKDNGTRKRRDSKLNEPELRVRTCYNMPVASRRTRSKSAVIKTAAYDPYDIDMDDMIESSKPVLQLKICSDQDQSNITRQKKEVTIVEKKNKKGTLSSYSKDEIIDSDDSSKSDVPLKRYVDDKERKKCELNKSVSIAKNIAKNEVENEFEKQNNLNENRNRRTFGICNIEDGVVTHDESVEQLRSEQFMESFGFFSERKPRKSNLLATKKISETFHIIANECDDMYFGFKGRNSKRSMQNENRKSMEGMSPLKGTRQRSPTSKKTMKRGRKKKTATVPTPSYCHICKKKFRRPDNYLRHQMTLLHVSKLSEVEMKIKTVPVIEEPNYLIAYKEHLDRIKAITDKMTKQKKKSKSAPKITPLTLEEILTDVKKIVREQQLANRGLSCDEELFLDCCELLKESHNKQEHVIDMQSLAVDTDSIMGPSQSANVGLDLLGKNDSNKCDSRNEGDVDSITAKTILESEEVRNLENDLISGLKEAANAGSLKRNNVFQRAISQEVTNQHKEYANHFFRPRDTGINYDHGESDNCEEEPEQFDILKSKKYPEFKEKMYPDIEEFDMFEDKFDKIKRKCRSQAAAAKHAPLVVEPSSSRKGRKKSERKKGKKILKKSHSSAVLTKGALKGFDGIKVSIPTSEINISAIVSPLETNHKRRKKGNLKKKKEMKCSEPNSKYDSDHPANDKPSTLKNVDVYEFMDNEDVELFEFRPSTLMERFKSISSKDTPSTSKVVDPVVEEADNSSASASDGDDFVYMSDDYVCSDIETENSLTSCDVSNTKNINDSKKVMLQMKRKDVVEKNAVMGKIFKNNAVRTEKKVTKSKEPVKPKANLDQLFDSLLEEEPSSSMLNDETLHLKDEAAHAKEYGNYLPDQAEPLSSKYVQHNFKKNDKLLVSKEKWTDLKQKTDDAVYSLTDHKLLPTKITMKSLMGEHKNRKYRKRRSLSPHELKSGLPNRHDETVSKSLNSQTKQSNKSSYLQDDSINKCTSPSKNTGLNNNDVKSHEDPVSKMNDKMAIPCSYNYEPWDQSLLDNTGVARQRARRKCTVGKQNILAETWSSESEPDGGPPRPNSAESVMSGMTRRKKGKKKDGLHTNVRRGNNRHISFKKQDLESRVSSSNRNTTTHSSGTSSIGVVQNRSTGSTDETLAMGASQPSTTAAFAAGCATSSTTATSAGAPSEGAEGAEGGGRFRTVFFWSPEGGETPEQHLRQQHGWIVGDSHKKLVTMLAHAKGRKRNNDDKRHLIE